MVVSLLDRAEIGRRGAYARADAVTYHKQKVESWCKTVSVAVADFHGCVRLIARQIIGSDLHQIQGNEGIVGNDSTIALRDTTMEHNSFTSYPVDIGDSSVEDEVVTTLIVDGCQFINAGGVNVLSMYVGAGVNLTVSNTLFGRTSDFQSNVKGAHVMTSGDFPGFFVFTQAQQKQTLSSLHHEPRSPTVSSKTSRPMFHSTRAFNSILLHWSV